VIIKSIFLSQTLQIIVFIFKDHVKSVLRISSAHNKGGPTDINIAQILHLSNFFELKRTLVYIHLQLRTRKVLDIQLVCLILQIWQFKM
jgi:hypothetical protein